MIRQWSMDNVCVHEQAHVTSTDISTSCILNGCVCVTEELISY